jgi:hypothetical protein
MIRIAILLSAVAPLIAADPLKLSAKFERLDPPKELQSAVRDSIASSAITASDQSGAIGAFWLRKEIPIAKTKSDPTYRAIEPGTLIGALQLARSWTDFRGNEAAAGTYTLRLALQPESKDHEGTAPYRDFCILLPAAADAKPDVLPLKTMVERSAKITGGTHPVVMLLIPHPKPAAEPAVLTIGKRIAIGVRAKDNFGFGFTLIGASTD